MTIQKVFKFNSIKLYILSVFKIDLICKKNQFQSYK